MNSRFLLTRCWLWSWLVAVLALNHPVARAATLPSGFTETPIPGPNAGNWNEAVGVTFDPNGRMFVWERAGRVWFRDPSDTSWTQLLDISEEVGNWGDHGCLGFALDPDFNVNGNIYLLYVVDRHHLMNFGTPNYRANSNDYVSATIGRVTRYTCTSSNNFRSVNLASRFILLGETRTNGIPILSDTHGVGSLVFGQDDTLLISCGDGATAWQVDTGGTANGSYAAQALADGIIRTKENIGAFRSQLVDCLGGKVLRIDPATGNGVPSNPFYDAANPRSGKSRAWTVGTRNPFRMSLRPNSGSHDAADANPGSLYIGNVGWDNWESLKTINGPAQNLGWPLFEGLEATPTFVAGGNYDVDVSNLDAPNPLYPGGGCSQYFSFRQLLKQDTTNAANQPPFNNPCNAGQKIPSTIPQFLHRRPAFDWNHSSSITRTPTYDATGAAVAANVGAVGSPVTGTQFQGNCGVGGAWFTSSSFPTQYVNSYFFADWGLGVIKNALFTTNDKPTALRDFATAAGAVVCMTAHPNDGSLYYVSYNYGDAGTVRQITYTGNRTPVAVATADQTYGSGPLTVQFDGSGSTDPDAQPLTYSWNFGDGTAPSTAASPAHTFTPTNAAPVSYSVTLTVTDPLGLSASTSILIGVNDTPPVVNITTPTNASLYSMISNSPFNLAASVTDAESPDNQLSYLWQTILHHNNHDHVVAASTNHSAVTATEPAGCDGVNVLYYRIVLTVTDPVGLATTKEVRLFPNCGATDTPPTISNIPNQATTLNVPTAALPFTIGDAQVAAQNLQLSATSSNPSLVPVGNVVFGGSASNRTVTVTPAPNVNGTATITVIVNDGPNDVSDTFTLTVTGTNTVPTISSLSDQTTSEATPSAPNPFTIGDANTPAANLILSGFAANPALIPSSGITFGGSATNRTVSVTSAPGQSGATTVTIVVSDGQLSASNSFNVTVTGLAPGTKSFTNAAAITIADVSPATPYPSTIDVAGLGGSISNVTVTLRGLTHTWTSDIDVLLVAPGGQKMLLMSDAGSGSVSGINLTFSASAASLLPTNTLASGTFRPADYPPADSFAVPAPVGPYPTNFSTFTGAGANGTWSLYVMDDGPGDTGSIGTGWTITIATVGAPGPAAPTISDIADQAVPINTATAAIPFTINDTDTAISNLTLSAASSNPALAPTNNIVFGGSGTNRTVTVTPVAGQTGVATITVTVSDGTNTASNPFLLTVGTVTTMTRSFTNAAFITIRDTNSASPYPSALAVSGMTGTISNVTVALRGFYQTWASDVDVLLVGPGGQSVMLMSDCGSGAVNNATFTFSDSAASALSTGTLTTGTYRPTDLTDTSPLGDAFPAPAPASPFGATLSIFSNTVPNGTWSLYILDDGPGDVGSVSNGWTMTITTRDTGGGSSNTAPTITAITNQTTLVNTATAAIPFTINDAETAASSLVLTAFSSNTNLVPTNRIVFGGSGSSRTVTLTPVSNLLGSASVVLSVSDGSLSASNNFTLTVNPALLTVTESNAIRGYGLTNPVLTGSLTGVQAGDNITASFSSSAVTNSPVGVYPIGVSLSDPNNHLGNYTIVTNNGTLTVTNAILTVTENSASRVYGATNPILTGSVTGLRAGDVITATFATIAATNSPVGTYPISFTLSDPGGRLGNYLVQTNNASLTVTPAALLVKAGDTNKVYRTVLAFTGREFAILGGALLNGNTLTNVSLSSPGTVKGAKVGTYPITASNAQGFGLTNYSITYSNGTLTVLPASLAITANSTAKTYGASLALPSNGYSVSDMEPGDSVTNVLLNTTGTDGTAPVGDYDIVPSNAEGVGLTNYAITYNNGTLTVNAADLLITALDTNKVYGATLSPSGYEVTGLLNLDNVTNVSLFTAGGLGDAPIGSYAIGSSNAMGAGLTNYTIAYTNGVMTVAAANLQITALDTNKVYGATLNPAGYAVSGLLNSDSVTNVALSSPGSVSNAPAGTFAITASAGAGDGLTNYSISYVSGTLTVTQAILLATADDKTRAYGQPNPAFTISYTGFVNGDGTNVLDVLPVAGTTATNTSAPGGYAIALAGGTDNNYLLNLANGTLTVTQPGPVTITTVEFTDPDHLRIAGTGDASVAYHIQASTDLSSWTDIGTATADGAGAFEFVDAAAGTFPGRFYRVATP